VEWTTIVYLVERPQSPSSSSHYDRWGGRTLQIVIARSERICRRFSGHNENCWSPSGNYPSELPGFLSISRMDARLINARALRVRFAKSLANRRHRLSQTAEKTGGDWRVSIAFRAPPPANPARNTNRPKIRKSRPFGRLVLYIRQCPLSYIPTARLDRARSRQRNSEAHRETA
jgi:hypothetical protein